MKSRADFFQKSTMELRDLPFSIEPFSSERLVLSARRLDDGSNRRADQHIDAKFYNKIDANEH